MKNQTNINAYILQAIRDNRDRMALTDFHSESFQYKDVARKITKLHILFENSGINRGDKVAFCGKNSSNWAIAFLATITYGAVAVPILHEFKPDNIHHLVSHSDAKLLFVDSSIWENLDSSLMTGLSGVINISDYSLLFWRDKRLREARLHLNEAFGMIYPDRYTVDDLKVYDPKPDDVAVINYTSGSTGFSKGVVLTYRSLWSNIQFSIDGLTFLKPGDGTVCMLPLAHMFGLTIELLHPFVKGCHISFLTRTPSPRVIMEAFSAIRPKLIISVPLIIEKIIKTKVFPVIEKPMMKLLLHLPVVDNVVLSKLKTKLLGVFGGQLQEMIIGGAAINKDVEKFLRRIDFPVTVGYGMTECGPLISYAPWREARKGASGKIVERMNARVDSPDPAHIPGVLWVKGDNVMKGYYKNDEATAAVFDKNGWMSTGDIGCIDKDGYIYLRGRDKNMILGPSGQNIYPEEIEQQLNNMPYVGESVVVDRNGKLVALIYPDMELVTRENLSSDRIKAIINDNVASLNKSLPSYSQISNVEVRHEEFEKTPKRSIKRYLYK